jgi:hypothetical protein
MPFKCSICEMDIVVGEPLLADAAMTLAHKRCVDKGDPPSVVETPALSKDVQLARSIQFKLNNKIPVPLSDVQELYGDPCTPSNAPALCVECHKPAIAMCPSCHTYVHQDFGYNGNNCSGRHEGRCEGARKSRSLAQDPQPTVLQVVELVGRPLNGRHKTKNGKARR